MSMDFSSGLETLYDRCQIGRWRSDAAFRLLLKAMKDINFSIQLDGVDCTESIPVVILGKLRGSLGFALQRLGAFRRAPLLNAVKRTPEIFSHALRQAQEVALRASNEDDRLLGRHSASYQM